MTPVTDATSPWYGITLIPRMVQNQLNHKLELRIIELDEKILRQCNRMLRKRARRQWMVLVLVFFLLLHVREIDTARNIFWRRYSDPVGAA